EPSRSPVVLMPSAYVNVSRMAIAYASTVPEMDFLLVATRRSGWLAEPSANVTVAKLASYARYEAFTRRERDELSAQWRHVRTDLESRSEEHTSELQSRGHLVCRLLLEKKKKKQENTNPHKQ